MGTGPGCISAARRLSWSWMRVHIPAVSPASASPLFLDGSAAAGQQHGPGWAPLIEVAVTQLPAFTHVWVVASLCVTS